MFQCTTSLALFGSKSESSSACTIPAYHDRQLAAADPPLVVVVVVVVVVVLSAQTNFL
jgi:hypothetical protein